MGGFLCTKPIDFLKSEMETLKKITFVIFKTRNNTRILTVVPLRDKSACMSELKKIVHFSLSYLQKTSVPYISQFCAIFTDLRTLLLRNMQVRKHIKFLKMLTFPRT